MARKRPFRNHTLLRVRQLQEDEKSAALAEVRREIADRERTRAEVLEDQRRTLAIAGEAATGRFDAGVVSGYYVYERHLAHLAVEADADLARLRRVEEERRAELEECMKRRRVVERLKERQNAAYAENIRKEEQTAADEIATVRAALAPALGTARNTGRRA